LLDHKRQCVPTLGPVARKSEYMSSTQTRCSRLVGARRERHIAGLGSLGVLAAVVLAGAGVAFAGTSGRLQTVGWANATLPGAVCKSRGPIELHKHLAQITRTGFGDVNSSGADHDLVLVSAAYRVTYGQLGGVGNAAAVDVLCSNNGGTADGQIRFADVVFPGSASGVRPLGLVTPQQPDSANLSHVPLLGKPKWVGGHIVVPEYWYGPNDPTCCASGRAITTWASRAGKLAAVRTVVTKRPRQ
jgi:hypothetical protein